MRALDGQPLELPPVEERVRLPPRFEDSDGHLPDLVPALRWDAHRVREVVQPYRVVPYVTATPPAEPPVFLAAHRVLNRVRP